MPRKSRYLLADWELTVKIIALYGDDFKIATLTYRILQFGSPSYHSSLMNLNVSSDFSALFHAIYYMFLLPPRPLFVKPLVLQLQQSGIPSHSVSSNHRLLALSDVVPKLIYLPSPASPFSHPATPAPPTRTCLNLCTIHNNNNNLTTALVMLTAASAVVMMQTLSL